MDRIFSPKNKGDHIRRESGQFYFVPREPGVTSEVRDKGDEDAVIEVHTDHTHDETFEPKPVNRSLSLMSQGGGKNMSSRLSGSVRADSALPTGVRAAAPSLRDGQPNPLSRTLFAIFGGNKMPPKTFDEAGAKKVDPKIFFSLERTFLAWMKAAVWVGAISIAVGTGTSKGTKGGALFSLFFQAIAILFILYALVTYAKRSLMVVRRSPGPYEDKWGPMVLGALFVCSLTAQYCFFLASSISTK
ncbi:DUF202 domain containing protein [Nitzschia inconspicua]|uniref:DUF202 domain containing protein n=1 Tax=Nitzschia inconspicua TaxID=303405 RepID=A0A9K3PI61_9STRA|nr:DUF202 domain containing protein [Nitzschia inconspicua]